MFAVSSLVVVYREVELEDREQNLGTRANFLREIMQVC